MEHQSGVTPGGDGRVREAFGDRGSGANFFSEVNGVGGNGGGDTAMAIGGNSNSVMDDGSGVPRRFSWCKRARRSGTR